MRGITFSFRGFRRKKRDKSRIGVGELKSAVKKHGVFAFFAGMTLCGLATGTIFSGGIDKALAARLDVLFVTSLTERLDYGAAETFCDAFCPDFIFFVLAFLTGLCLPGIAAMPFGAFCYGFGAGIGAGSVIGAYGLKGLGFYLAVLLPGTLIFGTALSGQLTLSYKAWRKLCRALFSRENSFGGALKYYSLASIKYLLLALAAALADTALRTLLAQKILG